MRPKSLYSPKIKALIRRLPTQDHSVTVHRKNWKVGVPSSVKQLFGREEAITIARHELHKLHNFSTIKLQKIILWGYPSGGRGKAKKMVGKRCMRELQAKFKRRGWADSWKSFFAKTRLKGIRETTLTKIAYFHGIRVQGQRSLILDSQIVAALPFWRELRGLKIYGVTGNTYPKYLTTMRKIARKGGFKTDQLEFFLFMFGQSL